MRDSEAPHSSVQRARSALLLMAAGLVAASAAQADGHAAYGASCAVCHGAHGEGLPATGAPVIAGLDAAYVTRQLKSFSSGARGAKAGDTYGATMAAAVAGLTDDAARESIARYVAALPRIGAAAGATANANSNGSNYWNALCSACHGANGRGNETLGAPRLAGVPVAYLARQFAAFKSGDRGAAAGDKLGAQMRAISAMLPDAHTETDVFAYVSSLPP